MVMVMPRFGFHVARSLTALLGIVAIAAGLGTPRSADAQDWDPRLLTDLKARAVGPATMSGRVAAVTVDPSDTDVLYVGAATGGLWKSTDGGLTFESIFDDQPVVAIGAVAVCPSNPNVIWVGTGEGNPRNSVSLGNGIYRSIDAGRTWTHLGLDDSERIHRIVPDPNDPDVAYVGVMGKMWGDSTERGVYKTEDGGESWERSLYVDESTGVADLVMDPSNPNTLLAALWDFRREPWFFRSGGPGSGLYRTDDGGATWTRLDESDGLPNGDLGRIGLAYAPSDPERVYALVEAEENVVCRSDDGGRTWSTIGGGENAGNRPFYFADLIVDPSNPNRVYSLWSLVSVSEDGGKSFDILVPFNAAHPDHHALWINPDDPEHLILGNDGGIAISRDRGRSWRFARNLPLGQYYHIRVDNETPFNIYGGMQDNGSWVGPSQIWVSGGIRNFHWQEVFFGDGFDTAPDPEDPTRGYAMSQRGFLGRWDLKTGERKSIRPAPPDPETQLRFNWNAGFAQDPFDPSTIYFGSQFLHRSTDRGETWETISDDLTTNNPKWQRQAESGGLTLDVTGAENFTTIVAIAPSPVQEGVLWVGTDDGRLHVTRDGGSTWESVENYVTGVPTNTWIPHIEVSRFDAGTAFVVFDDHKRSNTETYVYRTDDFGQSWTSLVDADDPVRGYAHCIVQDPVDPELLFLGAEFGLFASVDGGQSWLSWDHGLPSVGVRDLIVHDRDHDLVVGTHGRAAYVLDDVRPLRELGGSLAETPLHLFEPPPAQQYRIGQPSSARFPGAGEFRGTNRPYGALLSVWVGDDRLPLADDESSEDDEPTDAEPVPDQFEVTVEDTSGQTIRQFEVPAHRGINRFVWNLRSDGVRGPSLSTPPPDAPSPSGPEVVPGTYRVRIALGDEVVEGEVEVRPDPRSSHDSAARLANYEAQRRAETLSGVAAEMLDRIEAVRKRIDLILALAGDDEDLDDQAADSDSEPATNTEPDAEADADSNDSEDPEAEDTDESDEPSTLAGFASSLREKLVVIEADLWTRPGTTKGIVRSDQTVVGALGLAGGQLGSSWDRPTDAQLQYLKLAETQLDATREALNALLAEDVPAFIGRARQAELELMPPTDPITRDP